MRDGVALSGEILCRISQTWHTGPWLRKIEERDMRLEERFVTFRSGRTKNSTSRHLRRIGMSLAAWSCIAISGVLAPSAGAQEVLPFPPTPSASTAGLTMQDSIYKNRVDLKHLPANAPNILIILTDDVGPGQASTYGGEINTPNGSNLARLLTRHVRSPSGGNPFRKLVRRVSTVSTTI
jgi:hypothetical protein